MSSTLLELTDTLYRVVYPERKIYSYDGSLPSNQVKDIKDTVEKDAVLRQMYTELAILRSKNIERNTGGYNSNSSEPEPHTPQARPKPAKSGNAGIELVALRKKGGYRKSRRTRRRQ